MKSYKMHDSEVKLPDSPTLGEIERDSDGRIYIKRFRELFDPLQIDLAAVEALAALRYAGRTLHLLQERWGAKHDLSEGRMGVLFRLFRCGDMPLGELADDLTMTPRNGTGLVEHLERDGLVARGPDPEYRPSVRARRTDPGMGRRRWIWRARSEQQLAIV